MIKQAIFLLPHVILVLVVLIDGGLANTLGRDSGCGNLAGSCNERVCCCSSNGFLAQTPNSEGECEWDFGGGHEGPVFLIVMSVLPPLVSLCLFRFGRSLRLKHST